MILTISGTDNENAAKRKESVILEQRISLAEAIFPGKMPGPLTSVFSGER